MRVVGLLGIALAAVLSVGRAAEATVLTFDVPGLPSVVFVPAAYGDRVVSVSDVVNGFEYGLGNGFTPNVVVDYAAQESEFVIFPAGYGDLTNALGHGSVGFGEVVLTPDPGFLVVLHSLDVAPWQGTWADSQVRVLNAAGDVLFDSGLFTANQGQHYTFPSSSISSSTALRIINTTTTSAVVGFGYLGLDNVSFSQAVVPEPGVLALLVGGFSGLALFGRRRGRESRG